MTLREFIQLLRRNWLLLLAAPLVTAITIFFFSHKEVKEYASDTTIYTGIASTFNIDKNSTGSEYTNNKEYSNLISLINSRATKQEVALRLLARHLSLTSDDAAILGPEAYDRLHTLINDSLRRKLVGSSVEATTRNLTAYLGSSNNKVIYNILNSDAPAYSFTALNKIVASQVGTSDLVKIEYVADDAAICQQTLAELTKVFIERHKQLQEGRNGSVVGYFGAAAAKARQRLDSAEKKLLAFQRVNNLIDYDKQAESVAAQRNELAQQASAMEVQYAGAFSALQALRGTAKSTAATDLSSQRTYRLSNQLARLRTQISNAEIFNRGKPDAANALAIQKLKTQAEQTERLMQASINKHVNQSAYAQPATAKSLGGDLVKSALLVEELRTKLLLMRKQRDSFDKEYQKIAPLGAEKRSVEREREVAEKEYLAITSNLDQSQVAQHNIELTSQLKVVDPPYLATNRAKPKRKLMLLFGGLGTLLLAIGGLVAAALLDQSLRDPEVAKAKTRLPLFGILPDTGSPLDVHQPLFGQAEDQLARLLLLKMQPQLAAQRPYIVGIVSSHRAEGKSTVVASLATHLGQLGIQTLSLLPSDHKQHVALSGTSAFYAPLKAVKPQITLADLTGLFLTKYQVMLVEFPALLEDVYPVAVLPHLDIMLVTIDATRTWEAVDKALFEAIRTTTSAPIEFILNKMQADKAANYLGPPAAAAPPPPAATTTGLRVWKSQAALQA